MSYKTILVHVDDSIHLQARLKTAARLAIAQDAHLVGIALSGVSGFIEDTMIVNPYDPAITPYLDTLRTRANVALDRFDEQVRQLGVRSFERCLLDDEAHAGITLHARYADLVVVGQADPDERISTVGTDFPEFITISSGTPVLIVPYSLPLDAAAAVGKRVLIAWNGSREARRVLHDALPLLKQAEQVVVAIFNPAERPDLIGVEPGTDIGQTLARHGIAANVRRQHVDGGAIASTLLAIAADTTSDLLVMGCYGHSRLREMLLGGVTRDMLASMTVPVLMAH